MRVVRGRPPLFDEIDAKFNIHGRPVIFAWGDTIFVPSGSLDLHGSLVAHERVHGDRQLGYNPLGTLDKMQRTPEHRIVSWWLRYLADIDFRREEELLAHVAEYRHLCEHAGGRNERRRHLSIVAAKLSAPLYGPLMTKSFARRMLQNGYSSYS